MPSKNPDASRSQGGPGSSHQDARHPNKPRHHGASEEAGTPNPPHSRTSGGGGEADKHHTHDPAAKS